MCSHLIAKGFAVTVYNWSRSKAQSLLDRGAAWGNTSKWPSRATWCLALSVFRDVREVFLGTDGRIGGEQARFNPGRYDHSEPSLAVEIYEAAKAKGVHAVDAKPVSGGDVGAKEARLSIMIGGDKDAVEEALQPCWRRWARRSSIRVEPVRGNTRRW